MKTLTAENDFGRTKQTIALADIMVDEEHSVVDVASNWAVFPRHLQVATSIASTSTSAVNGASNITKGAVALDICPSLKFHA